MLADIAHGHTDAADVFFLIAVVLFGVAAIFDSRGGTLDRGGRIVGAGVILALGLASMALALLLL